MLFTCRLFSPFGQEFIQKPVQAAALLDDSRAYAGKRHFSAQDSNFAAVGEYCETFPWLQSKFFPDSRRKYNLPLSPRTTVSVIVCHPFPIMAALLLCDKNGEWPRSLVRRGGRTGESINPNPTGARRNKLRASEKRASARAAGGQSNTTVLFP